LPTSLGFERFYTKHQCTKPGSPLQTKAHEPNPDREAISSDLQKRFVTSEKIYYIYEKLVDLILYTETITLRKMSCP